MHTVNWEIPSRETKLQFYNLNVKPKLNDTSMAIQENSFPTIFISQSIHPKTCQHNHGRINKNIRIPKLERRIIHYRNQLKNFDTKSYHTLKTATQHNTQLRSQTNRKERITEQRSRFSSHHQPLTALEYLSLSHLKLFLKDPLTFPSTV